ncbi:MAG: PAS domain-containing sensor histidine kinase [Promethearchaeota archaeon]
MPKHNIKEDSLPLIQFKSVFKKIPTPIYIWKKVGNDFILADFNNAALLATKGKITKFIGVKARDFHKNDPANLSALFTCLEKQVPIKIELDYTFKTTGEKRTLYAKLNYIHPDLIVVSTIDITEQKKAKAKLRESEAKYRSIVESSHSGILIVDNNYKIKFVNNKLSEILGYSREELINLDFRELLPPKSLELVVDNYIKRQRGEVVPTRYEVNVRRKNGELRRIEIISTVITEGNEGINTIAQLLDITKQKRMEENLIKSEKKFQKIIEAIPDLFFLIKEDGTIIDYQVKEVDNLFFPKKLLNKKLVDYIPSEKKEEVLNTIKKTINNKQQNLIEYSIQDGQEKRFYEIRFLYFSRNTVITFIRDITKRKKIELLIKEEMNKLKGLDQIRKDLISTISHEFKTPIMAISGSCEIFKEFYSEELNIEILEMLDIIRRNKDRLEYLINNLIDVSRVEYKKLQIKKEPSDLCKIINEIVHEMQYYAKSRGVQLETKIPNCFTCNIDSIRMEQVFTNLISNAIKNTPPGGKVKIRLYDFHNKVIFSVKDNGIGFTKEELENLFIRFGKFERVGEEFDFLDIKGSGLGLFITKQIVELHGGTIKAISKGRFKGAKFAITLPIN